MLHKELSRAQIAGAALLVVLVGLLIWGAVRLQAASGAYVPLPIEVSPEKEEITGEFVPAPSAPAGAMTDEQARRREALENMKYGMQQAP